jgi:hypothetical protein
VALLREAIRRGYRDVEHVKKDQELDPIRERPDFQEVLLELQKHREQGGGR